MKKLLLLLLCVPLIGLGQQTGCISGDCVNGYGTYVSDNGDKYIGEWKNGKKHGFGTSDNLSCYGCLWISEWKNGKRHGFYRRYFPNGKLSTYGNHKDGKESGLWKFYTEDGKLNQEGGYDEDGEQDGLWRYYDYENGQLTLERNWKNGEMIHSKQY